MKTGRVITLTILLLGFMLIMGCNSGGAARTGDTVQVNYVGKLADGTIFDSSQGISPLKFTIGDNTVIPGFENAVIGMKVGGIKTVVIPADQAYGQHQSDLVFEVDKSALSENITPKVGMTLQSTQSDGSIMMVTIINISDKTITLDANHPLAGKDLTFEIQLMQIN